MTMPATVAAIRDLIRSQREAHTMNVYRTEQTLSRLRYLAMYHDSPIARMFRELDAHLSAGGTPPEAWREGPDAPADDPKPSELGRELHANGVHTRCPAECLTLWDDDGNDRTA